MTLFQPTALNEELKEIFYKYTPSNFNGLIFIWDLDKTYLATQFDSFFQLLRTAFEKAIHKKNIPGASSLLQQLQKYPACRTIFLSASPEEMRSTIAEKLILDEVEFDLLICKNQWEHIKRGEFSQVKEQIGYKLFELLKIYKRLPQAQFVAFGDDREFDATIYSLFEDITTHRLKGLDLLGVLSLLGVKKSQALKIAWLARQIPKGDALKKACIFLESSSDYFYFQKYGPKFMASNSYFQAMLVFYELGYLAKAQVKYYLDELENQGLAWRKTFYQDLLTLQKQNQINAHQVKDFLELLEALYGPSVFALAPWKNNLGGDNQFRGVFEKLLEHKTAQTRISGENLLLVGLAQETGPVSQGLMDVKYKYMDEIKPHV